MPKDRTILLVCTGNSCRSVMAWGLLKEMLKGKQGYTIITAGTGTIRGMSPTKETIEVMSEQNIDVSQHRSQPTSQELLSKADLILVMEKRHKEILSRYPGVQNKLHLLNESGDIPDPIGRPLEFYRQVLAVIKEAIVRTVKKLAEEEK